MPSDDQLVLPIIDSHIHLYPSSEADTLAWCTPDHPLHGQRSVEEYKADAQAPSLLGFVFVETDRKHDLAKGAADGSGWDGPLQEVRWLRRVATGQPKDGEGHTADDAKLCLGIIPWAPIPSGPAVLEKYLDKVKEEAGDETWAKVKGFRYLLQDKPHGTMLEQDFIDSLKLLGRRGFVFEVGVDQHRRGRKQLDELIEMVDRAHDGVEEDAKVKLIINHLCKPDLTVYNLTTDPSFTAWRTAIYALSKSPQVYMKLSGAFPEMPESLRTETPSRIFESTFGWLGVILATFGPKRIMFGSDWPVCTVGVPGAWPRWKEVVDKMCWMATLDDEDRAMIFGGTAKLAYGL